MYIQKQVTRYIINQFKVGTICFIYDHTVWVNYLTV